MNDKQVLRRTSKLIVCAKCGQSGGTLHRTGNGKQSRFEHDKCPPMKLKRR